MTYIRNPEPPVVAMTCFYYVSRLALQPASIITASLGMKNHRRTTPPWEVIWGQHHKMLIHPSILETIVLLMSLFFSDRLRRG